MELAYRQCQFSENTVIAARALKGLARALLTIADDVGQGWGILGAIGLRKGPQLSIRLLFKLCLKFCIAFNLKLIFIFQINKPILRFDFCNILMTL